MVFHRSRYFSWEVNHKSTFPQDSHSTYHSRSVLCIHILHFITQDIKKNPTCMQKSRFNNINTFYCFIKDTLKRDYMCVSVKNTLTLSWFMLRALVVPTIPFACNISIIMKIMLTSWPPGGPWENMRTRDHTRFMRAHWEPS